MIVNQRCAVLKILARCNPSKISNNSSMLQILLIFIINP